MKSKLMEDEIPEMDTENETNVVIDDYKDLELETLASTREKILWWMTDSEDAVGKDSAL